MLTTTQYGQAIKVIRERFGLHATFIEVDPRVYTYPTGQFFVLPDSRKMGQYGQGHTLDDAIAGAVAASLPLQPVAVAPGFYADPKMWELEANPTYAENPPDAWEDCDACGGVHPPGYTGDCRSDINRWPSTICIALLTGRAIARTS